jgi:hypothetical protein
VKTGKKTKKHKLRKEKKKKKERKKGTKRKEQKEEKKRKKRKKEKEVTFGSSLFSLWIGGDVNLIIGGNQIQMNVWDGITVEGHLVPNHHNHHTIIKKVTMQLPTPLGSQVSFHQHLSLRIFHIQFLLEK